MHGELLQLFFFIFSGGAIIASLALFGRQPLLVAYIVLGAILGPFGLELVSATSGVMACSERGNPAYTDQFSAICGDRLYSCRLIWLLYD